MKFKSCISENPHQNLKSVPFEPKFLLKSVVVTCTPNKRALFENMIVSEYMKRKYHNNERQMDLWYWRDSEKNEVDLLIEKPQETEIIEIKATQTVMSDLFKGLNHYAALETEVKLTKTLVYGGNESQKRSVARVLSWNDVNVSV